MNVICKSGQLLLPHLEVTNALPSTPIGAARGPMYNEKSRKAFKKEWIESRWLFFSQLDDSMQVSLEYFYLSATISNWGKSWDQWCKERGCKHCLSLWSSKSIHRRLHDLGDCLPRRANGILREYPTGPAPTYHRSPTGVAIAEIRSIPRLVSPHEMLSPFHPK